MNELTEKQKTEIIEEFNKNPNIIDITKKVRNKSNNKMIGSLITFISLKIIGNKRIDKRIGGK